MENLARMAATVKTPADYFSGIGREPWCWPLNLIAFSRLNRRDLQRRTFESRLHTRYVLIVNLGTAGTLNLDSTPYRLRPGHAHLVFPHQLHTYHDVAGEDILWLFITFELPSDTPLRALRQATVPINGEMQRLLEQFVSAYRAKKTSPHVLQTLLSGVLLQMVQSADTAGARRKPLPDRDNKLLETIHRHHADTLPGALTVQKLAEHVRLSESRLRTKFRTTFGLSLGEYLQNLRLQEAIAMMRHSQATITEVALSCGFGSSSAFSRAFKNWAGRTPRDFRRSVTAKDPHTGPVQRRGANIREHGHLGH